MITSITWLGNSGSSRIGFLIGLVEPRRAGILAALLTGGCSEGRLPGVVVSALRFFVLEEGTVDACGIMLGVVEVEVTTAEMRGGETMLGVCFITSDVSTLTDGATSFFNCGAEITEGVLSASATVIKKNTM